MRRDQKYGQSLIQGAMVFSLLYASVSLADDEATSTPPVRENATVIKDKDIKKEQQPANNWRILPQFILSSAFDDNIFATRNNRVGDTILVASPSVVVNSNWKKHFARFDAGADIVRYAANKSENHEHFRISGEGRYDLTPQSNVYGGLLFRKDVEDRESPDDVFGTEPTIYYDSRAYAGYFRQFTKWSLRTGVTVNALNFNDVNTSTGILNNDDRDRTDYTGGVRLGYNINAGLELYGQAAFDIRRYNDRIDDNGFMRDSDGYRLIAGLKLGSAGSYTAGVYAGALGQDYDDPVLPDVNSTAFGANFTWFPSPLTTLNAYIDRTLEETTLSGASSYLYTSSGLTLTYQPVRDVTFRTFVTYSESDYQGIDRNDELSTAGAAVKYFISNRIFIQGDYQFRHNVSNIVSQRYDRNQIFLRLGGYLYDVDRGRRRSLAELLRSANNLSGGFNGFYAGVSTGRSNLATGLRGTRGPSDTVKADYANDGPSYGLFAGYGRTFNNWYLGIEAEGDRANTQWNNTNTGSRIFSVERKGSYALLARLGYVLPYGSLIYAGAGAAHTNFASSYTFSGVTINQDNSDTDGRFSVGVDVPATSALFLRADYSYTAYNSYDIAYTSTRTDTFSNNEGLFRIGVAWQFDGALPSRATQTYAKKNLHGFYAGTQFGHEYLDADVSGLRGASAPFTANQGGEGASWGVFAGYGVTLNCFYAGLEIEADGGNADWQFDRGSNRNYNVVQKITYGASARLGYVLANGTLIYGRLGTVRADFATRYTQASNFVDVDNTQSGTRIGLGVEVPVSTSFSLRMDYTHTRFDGYDVNYITGVDNFKHHEELFRLGALFHF